MARRNKAQSCADSRVGTGVVIVSLTRPARAPFTPSTSGQAPSLVALLGSSGRGTGGSQEAPASSFSVLSDTAMGHCPLPLIVLHCQGTRASESLGGVSQEAPRPTHVWKVGRPGFLPLRPSVRVFRCPCFRMCFKHPVCCVPHVLRLCPGY